MFPAVPKGSENIYDGTSVFYSRAMSGGGKGQKIRVIAIDDEADMAELLKVYLEDIDPGLSVDSFSLPEALLERLREEAYDVIVSDHLMPGMSGLELAERVRRVWETPIILYTGRGSEEVASEAFALGVTDYLRKEPDPRHFEALARRIRRVVEDAKKDDAKPPVVRLPDYPRVVARGFQLFIQEGDGSESLWGTEIDDPIGVAREMDLELRAMRWVRDELAGFVARLTEALRSRGISEETVPDVVYEGYRGLLEWFMRMDVSHRHRSDE